MRAKRTGRYGPYDTLDRLTPKKRLRPGWGMVPDQAAVVPVDRDVAIALRQARRAAKLTQDELARKAVVKRGALANWETAHRSVTAEAWRRLRTVLPDLPEGREVWPHSGGHRIIRL